VARRLRDQDDIAVVFLTGATALEDRLAGFQAGADDYVTKPFFIEELNARIHAVLRRRGVSSSAIWNVADLSVDEGTREVRRGDSPIELTRTEFEILLVLVRYRGRVVPRAALAEAVWGYDHSGSAVGVHMSALRRKLEAHGERCIHTMRGVGYILRSPSAEGP
jgi:two-component system response regulator MprA